MRAAAAVSILVSLVSVFYSFYLIYDRSFCRNATRVLFLQALRIPSSVVILTRKLGKLGCFSVMLSSILVFISMSYILGAFSQTNWVFTGLIIAPTSLAPVAVTGWTFASALGLAGFALGAVPFPLDWPICWKEPPIPHVFLHSLLSLIGSVVDLMIQ